MQKIAGHPAKFHSTGFCQNDQIPAGIRGALIRPPLLSLCHVHLAGTRSPGDVALPCGACCVGAQHGGVVNEGLSFGVVGPGGHCG